VWALVWGGAGALTRAKASGVHRGRPPGRAEAPLGSRVGSAVCFFEALPRLFVFRFKMLEGLGWSYLREISKQDFPG
jgi:hypothetical protein